MTGGAEEEGVTGHPRQTIKNRFGSLPCMARIVEIPPETDDPTLNICLETLKRGKQALVFCNTKRGAESQAERLAQKVTGAALLDLAERAVHTLSSPTKQCKRLALCLRKGVAFHHAGLHAKQRELVENGFRDGTVKVICSTPTLAMGLDLPAFRVIIRDLKRFGSTSWGMTDIPVLEYHQMAGRAGRPGKESYGEAILLAESEEQKEAREERYVFGEPEEILSKLAVEPVLRTYVLSLIAAEFVSTSAGLHAFFARTFYARQYGDTRKLNVILDAMVARLREWGLLVDRRAPERAEQGAGHGGRSVACPVSHKESPVRSREQRAEEAARLFISADELRDGKVEATPLGKRVAELYLDPYTAHHLHRSLSRATRQGLAPFATLHMLSSCLELRPWLRPKAREVEDLVTEVTPFLESLLVPLPLEFTPEWEEFLMTLKTALFLHDWVEEAQEDALLEKYGIAPGEVHAKLEKADWLIYAAEELARILNLSQLRAPLAKMRRRLKHGAKEELLPLLRLKGIGRVRGRKLFNANVKSIQDVKETEVSTLSTLIGKQVALDLKKQVGQELDPEKVRVKPGKRKGQTSMADYVRS